MVAFSAETDDDWLHHRGLHLLFSPDLDGYPAVCRPREEVGTVPTSLVARPMISASPQLVDFIGFLILLYELPLMSCKHINFLHQESRSHNFLVAP